MDVMPLLFFSFIELGYSLMYSSNDFITVTKFLLLELCMWVVRSNNLYGVLHWG